MFKYLPHFRYSPLTFWGAGIKSEFLWEKEKEHCSARWCEQTCFCWIFSMVWNVACPWGEGFLGSRQPSQVQGWDRSALGMALQACCLTSCVTQCLILPVVWFCYWGKLCKWWQNVKCMSVCRHELTKCLGVGHGSWGFKKRWKHRETDPSHTETGVWVRTTNS